MADLNEEQKAYIQRYEAWKATQQLLIEGINLTISNSRKMVENHQATLNVSQQHLLWELKFLDEGIAQHEDWLKLL